MDDNPGSCPLGTGAGGGVLANELAQKGVSVNQRSTAFKADDTNRGVDFDGSVM